MAVLGALEQPLDMRPAATRRRASAVAPWLPFVLAAAGLHAAVLFFSLDQARGTRAEEFISGPLEVTVALPRPELLVDAVPEPPVLHMPVQFSSNTDSSIVLAAPEPHELDAPSARHSVLPAVSILENPGIPGGSPSGARGGPLASGTDSPLAAGPIGIGFGTGEGSGSGQRMGVASSGGGASGESGGRGGGAGGTGRGRKGGGSHLDRAVNLLRAPGPAPVLNLQGKPIYPRACREGLCRNGLACQGSSIWKVWVSAEGGRPTRVEAVKKMDCELQNAAIRKWFSEAKFPSSGSDCVHQIPVKMMMEE